MARVHGWCGAHERKRGFEEELRVDGGARLEARESERAHEGSGNGKAQVDGVVSQWEEVIVGAPDNVGAPYNASCGGSGLGLWWERARAVKREQNGPRPGSGGNPRTANMAKKCIPDPPRK